MFSILKFTQLGLTFKSPLPSSVEMLCRDLYLLLCLEKKKCRTIKHSTVLVKSWAKFSDDLVKNETNLWLITVAKVNSDKRRLQSCINADEAQSILSSNSQWERAKRHNIDEVYLLVESLLKFDKKRFSEKFKIKQEAEPTSDIPALLCAYGLLKIDQVFRNNLSNDRRLNGIAIAGRLLAYAQKLTQWENVNNPTPSQIGKFGSSKRWASLDEIKSEVRQQFLYGVWKSKAAFIRAVRSDVLARSRDMKCNLVAGNIDRTIRKWLDGLTSKRHDVTP